MKKRGRTKGANGEKRKQLLLQVAAESFAKNGYHETRISTIVQKAGVTQPSFYLYFKSKEAIFLELVEEFQQKLFALIQQSRLEAGLHKHSLEENITRNLTQIFTFFKEQPDLTKIGFYMAQESAEIKNKIVNKIEQNLGHEQDCGYFNEDINVHIAAESLVGIIERLTTTKILTGLATPNEIARQIVHLLLHGMMSART